MSSPPEAVPCPEIGKGWTLQAVPRKTGNRIDRYWYSPCGKRFCSRPEVDRFLKSQTKSFGTNPPKEKVRIRHALGKVIYKPFPSEEEPGLEVEYKGSIEDYDPKRKLYKVVYEDDDEEELSEGEIDRLIKRKRNERRNERRRAARAEAALSNKSPSPGNVKRKATEDAADKNPYKKQYRQNKSPAPADDLGASVIRSNGKSKPKKRSDNPTKLIPPLNIPPDEMRAAIIENRLPIALNLQVAPRRSSNQSQITLKAAAQNRLVAAKKWVASAALNVESAKQQLDAALKARHEALNEQLEAQVFLNQVSCMTNGEPMGASQRPTMSLELPTKTSEKDALLPDKDPTVITKSQKTTEQSTDKSEADSIALMSTAKDQGTETEDGVLPFLAKPNENNTPDEKNHDKANTTQTNDNESTTDAETSTEHKQQLNALPLKKRPSNLGKMVTTSSSDDECNSDDGKKEYAIYLKTVHPGTARNRRFNDLAPDAQEVLRKSVLSSLSNNGKVDPADMKRAKDAGIPEQSVVEAVQIAWNRLRHKAKSAAKGKMLHGIEFKGFSISEFDGVYDMCQDKRSDADPDSKSYLPPSFQKKLTQNGKTTTFRLYYIGNEYKNDPSKWEIMSSAGPLDEDGKTVIRYKGSITRPEGDSETKSFCKAWVSTVGEECDVTVTPLYIY